VYGVVGSFSPNDLIHARVIEKATNASKENLIEVSASPLDSGEYGAEPVNLIAKAAVEITTNKLCPVVSMHGLDEAVVLALELDDEITQRTTSIGLLLQ
jgi:hypothetical protein